MTRQLMPPYATGQAGHPRINAASPRDEADDGLDKLKAYLECRSRRVDPPAPLAQAWDHFYQSYAPRIRALLRRSGLREADREDCSQDVWKEVIAHLGHLPYQPRGGRLSAWLMTVARNRAVDLLRRGRRLIVGLDLDRFAQVDHGPEPADECEGRRTRILVRRVLAELSAEVSARSFQVLYQRGLEGRSNAEVAEALGLTPEQVRSRNYRMRRKFRELFERSAARDPSDDDARPPMKGPASRILVQRNGPSCD
jgi:RNA polymerase sigma-70 factor (ECF subfamily)